MCFLFSILIENRKHMTPWIHLWDADFTQVLFHHRRTTLQRYLGL